MAKKVLTMIKLQIPAGAANPAPPVGPALGQHGVNIMEFCKAFNAQTQAQKRHHHPRGDHRLRGPLVHLHHQDAAGGRAAPRGPGHRQGLGRAQARQGRHASPGAGARDRRDQDAGSQRQRRRGRHEDHRGHGPQHGRRQSRLTTVRADRCRRARPTIRYEWPRSTAQPMGRQPKAAASTTGGTSMATGRKYSDASDGSTRAAVQPPRGRALWSSR